MKTQMRSCWLCGRNGTADPLDRHHIFGGSNREKSERYGLVVDLCHHDCHIFGRDSVHLNADTMRRLHAYGQIKAMRENGWSIDDFIREFGKNYLDSESESVISPCDIEDDSDQFMLLEDAAPLPF